MNAQGGRGWGGTFKKNNKGPTNCPEKHFKGPTNGWASLLPGPSFVLTRGP